jgi:virulence-associated protein VagC
MGVGLRWYEMSNVFTSTAKIIEDGEYQMVNMPEGFEFDANEVWAKKIGNSVILTPKDKLVDSEEKALRKMLDVLVQIEKAQIS